MNFLEQLVAEWYAFQGYFVRTNIKFGKRAKGGYLGEMDVIAFHPKEKTLTHIETSMDADSWLERKKRFQRKFQDANSHFKELFDFSISEVRRIAIVGFGKPKEKEKADFGYNIKVISIPDLIKEITSDLSNRHPMKNAIPEEYPLLRSIQFATFWGVSKKRISLKRILGLLV